MFAVENLRKFRKEAGYTQTKLAELLGTKQYSISDYELGRIEPSIETLIKLADIYGISLDELCGHTVVKKKTK